ncbi:MAG TPA: hypothetical protein VGM18_14460 [Candidatus Sulfotelmatobacter sp.]|jgi:hypothetical protein
MISLGLANTILIASLIISVSAYLFVSRREGSYLNILTPSFLTIIPAYYLLPLFFAQVFGNDARPYAYIYVYTTLAVENVAFAYAYTRPVTRVVRLPFGYSYRNFGWLALGALALAVMMYAPILMEFPEYILDPRQIYTHTRTGFGLNFYTSSVLAYLAVILILFSGRSRLVKGMVILASGAVLALHGSKGQVLSLVLLIAVFEVYVKMRKVKFLPALFAGAAMGFFALLLLAATMTLGESPAEVLESVSSYSDYTRNAMMVIDANFPVQYGRLTLESQILGRIPRALMPDKPKNFGGLYLDDWFYPQSLDEDVGSPDFGIGVQYADFGVLAIVYLALFSIFRGWLARVFVDRLRVSGHPSDFVLVAFLADIALIPVGGIGWLLPEIVLIALFLRFASSLGADKIYSERIRFKSRDRGQQRVTPTDSLEGI